MLYKCVIFVLEFDEHISNFPAPLTLMDNGKKGKSFRQSGPRPLVEAAKRGKFSPIYCFRFNFWPPLTETLGTAYSDVVDDDGDGLCHFAAVDGKKGS